VIISEKMDIIENEPVYKTTLKSRVAMKAYRERNNQKIKEQSIIYRECKKQKISIIEYNSKHKAYLIYQQNQLRNFINIDKEKV
jgi:hypothetical protein